MLTIKCNNCDAQFQCDRQSAGEQLKCPQCGAHLRVPFDAPDLDAIKKRAAPTSESAPPAILPPENDDLNERHTPLETKDVIQATVHDLYSQDKRHHAVVTAYLETLHRDLETLGSRLHTVTFQLFAVLIVVGVCTLLLLISIFTRV